MKNRHLVIGQDNSGKTKTFCFPEILKAKVKKIFYIGKSFDEIQLIKLKESKIDVININIEDLINIYQSKSKNRQIYILNSKEQIEFQNLMKCYINDRKSMIIINNISLIKNLELSQLLNIKNLLITTKDFNSLENILNYNSNKFLYSFKSLSFPSPILDIYIADEISNITGIPTPDIIRLKKDMYIRYYPSHFFKIKYIKKDVS